MGKDITLSVVDSSAGLMNLRDEWNHLLDASSARSICLRWEWIHTWWDIYHDCGVKPCVLLVRDDARLVGLAPFYLQIEKKPVLGSIRTLRFLGTGEPEQEEVASEYLDIVALTGYEDQVAKAVWAHLRDQEFWDQLVFNDVLEGSLVLTTLRHVLTAERIPVALEKVGIRYSVALPPTWQEYIAMLDDGAAKRLPYKRRKFERAGRVEYKSVTEAEELDQAFDELIRLHTKRWKARGGEGVFASSRFADYHRRLAKILLPQGMLNLGFLSLDGVNIAAHYNLRHAGTEYFYQGGADVEIASKYSPGVIGHVYAIEAAILGGIKRYDFMKGGTNSYKTEFGCGESPMHDMRVFARTFRGRALAMENWARGHWRSFRRGREDVTDADEIPGSTSSRATPGNGPEQM